MEREHCNGGTVTAKNNSEGSVDSPALRGNLVRVRNAKITIPNSVGTIDIPTVEEVESAISDRFALQT